MKNLRTILTLILAFSFLLSACGPQETYLTRAQELADTGILGRHPLKGVSSSKDLEGSFSEGYVLLIGGGSGSISQTENFTFAWYPRPGDEMRTKVPGSKVHIVTEEYSTAHPGPEIEYVLDSEYLNLVLDGKLGSQHVTENEKIDPNLILENEYSSLVIVRIYLSAADQKPGNICTK